MGFVSCPFLSFLSVCLLLLLYYRTHRASLLNGKEGKATEAAEGNEEGWGRDTPRREGKRLTFSHVMPLPPPPPLLSV